MKRLVALLAVAAVLAAQPAPAAGITDSAVATTAKFIHRTLIFTQSGAITTNTADVASWKAHEDIKILAVYGSCRLVDATVANCDVQNGTQTVLTTKPDIDAAAAAVVATGVVNATYDDITAGSTLHVDFNVTGTSITDCVCEVVYRTLGYGE